MTKLFSNLILLLLLTFALWSCNNDEPQAPEIKGTLTVAKAKEWYEKFVMKNSLSNQMKAKIAGNAVDSLQPLLNWDIAELDNDSVWSVVELPWEYKDYTVQISNSEVSEYATLQNDKSVIKQVIRLVILQNRKTGETYGFKMVVVPDLDYMLLKDDAIAENKYLQRGSDLSGAVLFYSVNDVFINGWKYENGKITAKILPENGSAVKKDDSNRFNASASWTYIRIQTCYVYYTISGGVVSELRPGGCTIRYLSVYNVDGEGGGGGGIDNTSSELNGGSIAGTTSSSSTDKPVDCANVAGGTAYQDKCERCVGGTTGRLPCDKDCAELYSLKKDNALISKLQGYINDIEFGSMLEDGYMKKSDGSYVTPSYKAIDDVKFKFYTTDKFTESVHTHSIGTYIFSPYDLITMTSLFLKGNMVDPLKFRSIVVSSLGIGYLQITDVNAFSTFCQTYSLDDLKRRYKDTSPQPGNGMTDYLKQFMDILSSTHSGLTFSVGEIDMSNIMPVINWNIKQSDVSGNITDKNCN